MPETPVLMESASGGHSGTSGRAKRHGASSQGRPEACLAPRGLDPRGGRDARGPSTSARNQEVESPSRSRRRSVPRPYKRSERIWSLCEGNGVVPGADLIKVGQTSIQTSLKRVLKACDRLLSVTTIVRTCCDRSLSVTTISRTCCDRLSSVTKVARTCCDRLSSVTTISRTCCDRLLSVTTIVRGRLGRFFRGLFGREIGRGRLFLVLHEALEAPLGLPGGGRDVRHRIFMVPPPEDARPPREAPRTRRPATPTDAPGTPLRQRAAAARGRSTRSAPDGSSALATAAAPRSPTPRRRRPCREPPAGRPHRLRRSRPPPPGGRRRDVGTVRGHL